MRVFTKNSVYTITAEGSQFYVRRTADAWGRVVKDAHAHYSERVSVEVGGRLLTETLRTSEVLAVVEG